MTTRTISDLIHSPSYSLYKLIVEGHYCYQMRDEIGVIHAVQTAKLLIKAKSTVLSTPVRCDDLHRLFVLEKNGYSKGELLSLTNEDIHRIADDEIDPDRGAHAITTDNEHLLYHTFRNVYSLPIHWISCLGNNSMAQMVMKHYLPNEFKGGEDPLHTGKPRNRIRAFIVYIFF